MAIEELRTRLTENIAAFEKDQTEKAGQPKKSGADKDLLNGPQTPELANQQGDIAALMASLD